MKKITVLFTLLFVSMATAINAQKPVSGTYRMGNVSTGKWVKAFRSDTGSPNAAPYTEYDKASDLFLGVGVKYEDESNLLYSLKYANQDVYDYFGEYVGLAVDMVNSKIDNFSTVFLAESLMPGLDISADVDSILNLLVEGYGKVVLETVPMENVDLSAIGSAYDVKSVVRLRIDIPEIPEFLNAAAWYFVGDSKESQDGFLWYWATGMLKEYNERFAFIEQLKPGTSYYIIGEDDNTFGYVSTEEITDDAQACWALVGEESPEKLSDQICRVKNAGSDLYINCIGEINVKPNLAKDEIDESIENIVGSMASLEMGRVRSNETDKETYQLSSAKVNGFEAYDYINETMTTITSLCDAYLQEFQNGTSGKAALLKTMKINISSEDVATLMEWYKRVYANIKLTDNNDGTVSMFVKIPASLTIYEALYNGNDVWAGLQDSICAYIEANYKSNISKKAQEIVKQTEAGHTYYLAANPEDSTFTLVDAAKLNEAGNYVKWVLDDMGNHSVSGYYRVKNAATNHYIALTQTDKVAPSVEEEDAISDAATVAYLTFNADENGTLTVKEMKQQGVTAPDFTVLANSIEGGALAFNASYKDNYVAEANSAFTAASDLDDDAAKWIIEKIDDKHVFGAAPAQKTLVDGFYYTTLYTAFPYQVAENAKVNNIYVIKNLQDFKKGTYAMLDSLQPGDVIPAYTPVIIETTTTNAAKNVLIPVTEEGTAIEDNLLKGSLFTVAVEDEGRTRDNVRVIDVVDGVLGLYSYTGENLKANKAYLDLTGTSTDAQAIIIDIEGKTTAITNVISDINNGNNKVYDLMGREVNAPSKGIYIINGKKVLIK